MGDNLYTLGLIATLVPTILFLREVLRAAVLKDYTVIDEYIENRKEETTREQMFTIFCQMTIASFIGTVIFAVLCFLK